jgi:hypothetical protein
VAERPDAATQTCEIRWRGGRLPDLQKLSRHLDAMRVGAALRGVEMTADGALVEKDGEILLRISGAGEAVRLAALQRTVHWDVVRKQARKMSDAEQSACSRLRSEWRVRPGRVRVTGPLVANAEAGICALEVRQFAWLP